MKKLLKFLLLIAIIVLAVRGWYFHGLSAMDSSSTQREVVKIPKGSSTADIADILEEKGLIRSAFIFRWYAKSHDLSSGLQAGSFVIEQSMDVPAILEVLRSGKSGEASITIPEGFTLTQIDALLAQKGISESGAILACAQTCDFSSFTFLPKGIVMAKRGGKLEGYLFPDTYFVLVDGFEPKFFLERLLTTFQHRVVEKFADDIKASKRSLHEIITMASLIEEETRTGEERPIVAGILWKRYDAKLGLGVDATVRYILEKSTGTLTAGDLNVNSPYNLRKFRGLPPGPIASPSLSSIEAALHPKDSPYMYYLHGKDGKIHYAVTNEEHNANRHDYL